MRTLASIVMILLLSCGICSSASNEELHGAVLENRRALERTMTATEAHRDLLIEYLPEVQKNTRAREVIMNNNQLLRLEVEELRKEVRRLTNNYKILIQALKDK